MNTDETRTNCSVTSDTITFAMSDYIKRWNTLANAGKNVTIDSTMKYEAALI